MTDRTLMTELASSLTPIKYPPSSRLIILKNSLMENPSNSRSGYLQWEIQTWIEAREQRLARIRAIKGKYASILISSEEFAKRKREGDRNIGSIIESYYRILEHLFYHSDLKL